VFSYSVFLRWKKLCNVVREALLNIGKNLYTYTYLCIEYNFVFKFINANIGNIINHGVLLISKLFPYQLLHDK